MGNNNRTGTNNISYEDRKLMAELAVDFYKKDAVLAELKQRFYEIHADLMQAHIDGSSRVLRKRLRNSLEAVADEISKALHEISPLRPKAIAEKMDAPLNYIHQQLLHARNRGSHAHVVCNMCLRHKTIRSFTNGGRICDVCLGMEINSGAS